MIVSTRKLDFHSISCSFCILGAIEAILASVGCMPSNDLTFALPHVYLYHFYVFETIMILPFNQASFLFPAVSSANFAFINCIDSGATNVNFPEISVRKTI